jgi:excisionase family DNA binding protein
MVYLTHQAVAILLGISTKTLSGLIKVKRSPVHFMVGKRRRWLRQDVDLWIEQNKLELRANHNTLTQ